METFKYLQSKLEFGSIIKTSNNLSRFTIYRFELFYIIVPLLLKYNIWFITDNRNSQYNKLLYIIENNIKLGKNLPNFIPEYNPYDLTNPEIIYNLSYFKNWFIGFTMAEGSFYVQPLVFRSGTKGKTKIKKLYLV